MIHIDIHTQPDDETCGPTSLHAIYAYYGLTLSLKEVICSVERAYNGGTLASMLGTHALLQGFEATLYVNNVNLFDPSWFHLGVANKSLLNKKLQAQMKFKRAKRFLQASESYLHFMDAGGEICFTTVNKALLTHFFEHRLPVLTGLSATYLYQSARERFTKDGLALYDDVRGTPCGHFVILCGFDEQEHFVIADPHRANPIAKNNYYAVDSDRLINAIMLGVLTFDANLLIIKPKENSPWKR